MKLVKQDMLNRVNPTVCLYNHPYDKYDQAKFLIINTTKENPVEFVRKCERGVDLTGERLTNTDW